MGYDLKPIDAHKRQIVQELFIDTADDNYITARWCFVEGLNVDYFWLAVHALEKYMKAVLLLNGKSSKGFGHDIVKLYKNVESLASDLLPDSLKQPDALVIDHKWLDESPEEFSQRLYENGNAENRYQIFGFLQHYDDLFKLDLMVFALRRLCVSLDGYCKSIDGDYLSASGRNLTYRDVLINQPKQWKIPSGKLEKTVDGKCGDRLSGLLLDCNFPFAPDDFTHSDLQERIASQNPVLGRLVLRRLDQATDRNSAKDTVKLCDWVIQNIQLSKGQKDEKGKKVKGVNEQLCEAKRDAKAKWGI